MNGAPCERAWIALGSNLGPRRRNLEGALAALEEHAQLSVLRCSSWHETAPVGGPPGQGPFLNGVAELETSLGAQELLHLMQSVEQRFGRQRPLGVACAPRTLDLDLLLFGERCFWTQALEVPHPRMEDRAFVLAPLCELEPDLILPASGRRVRDRLAELQPAMAGGGDSPAPR